MDLIQTVLDSLERNLKSFPVEKISLFTLHSRNYDISITNEDNSYQFDGICTHRIDTVKDYLLQYKDNIHKLTIV